MKQNINQTPILPVTTTDGWSDYKLIDTGEGMKLEQYGEVILARPEPEAFWQKHYPASTWGKAHALYNAPNQEDDGYWTKNSSFPSPWFIDVDGIRCKLQLSRSRHIGIFPEQYPQWIWLRDHIAAQNKPVKVLNLFGYTGMASLFAAQAGAHVTHVDASKKAVLWAKENQAASKMTDKPISWIVDDALKFARREARREKQYEAIVLDPPKFGRGPNGEVWEFYKYLPNLLDACEAILSDDASFLLLTAYAVKASALTLQRVLEEKLLARGGQVQSGELAQQEKDSQRYLSRALYALWKK